MLRHLFVAGAASAGLLVGCSIGESNYETITYPVRATSQTRTCSSPMVKVDLAKQKPCGGGKGHCYDGSKVLIAELEDCSATEKCVPDKLLVSGGGKLKACKFFIGGAPGACMSLLVKDIAAHKDELKQDVCDADERCAPCVNPLTGEDTKLCAEIGAHQDACVGGPAAARGATCCHGAGICSKKEGIPADKREDLSRDSCPENNLCAPAALVDGKPVKCDVAGVSGVCLDFCFASMLKGTQTFMRGGCRATEVCLPCVIGSGQGMPGC